MKKQWRKSEEKRKERVKTKVKNMCRRSEETSKEKVKKKRKKRETNFIPYEIFPNSKFYFYDAVTNKKWISIRPNQFMLHDMENSVNKKVFSGRVESLKKIGSKYKN